MDAIRRYIQQNPAQWAHDRDNLEVLLSRMTYIRSGAVYCAIAVCDGVGRKLRHYGGVMVVWRSGAVYCALIAVLRNGVPRYVVGGGRAQNFAPLR
ncbi:MAG: hypothetical protein IPL28_19210 [Chloroflexi bacterium]|nr:hypothetical protein [Chloroflexota bacterium]